MKRDPRLHMTDEEFIAFVMDDLTADDAGEVDQHIERCAGCTTKLESFFEAQETFPDEAWASRRESFVAQLRQQVFPIKASSLLERLTRQLQALSLPRGDWSLSLTVAQADTTLRSEDGQTEDGLLRWRIVETESQDLIVRFGSYQTELKGVTLRLKLGEIQKDIVLHQVASDQVGGETVITRMERNKLVIDALLHIELLDPN